MAACADSKEALGCIADAGSSEAVTACFEHCKVDLEVPDGADPDVAAACIHVVQVVAGESGQNLAVSDCIDGLADNLAACETPTTLLACLGKAASIDDLAACEDVCK